MKRLIAISALTCLTAFVFASSSSASLSPLIHPAWSKTADRADASAAQGEYTHALALLEGGIYSHGVTIALNSKSLGRNADKAQAAFNRAIGYWQDGLGSDCPLRAVDAPTADAVVNLVDHIPGDGEELGLIEIKKSYQWTTGSYKCSTNAKISVMRSFENKTLSEDEMTEVMAHEIGHLLGLADVDQSGFLMGPMDRDHLTHGPTPAEVEAVFQMRRELRSSFTSLVDLAHLRRAK